MVTCPKCGASTEGGFCAACGFAIDPAAPSSAPETPTPVAMSLPENVASALRYLLGFITGVLFLILAPFNQSKTVRFHAFQSILFSVAVVCIWIVFGILAAAFAGIPFVGWLVTTVLWLCLSLAIFAGWLVLMWKAYSGENFALPIIGPLAKKQA